jgi:hypothetical protein
MATIKFYPPTDEEKSTITQTDLKTQLQLSKYFFLLLSLLAHNTIVPISFPETGSEHGVTQN